MSEYSAAEVVEEAASLIERLGKGAERFALVNADQLTEHGDENGATYWGRVANAVAALETAQMTIH